MQNKQRELFPPHISVTLKLKYLFVPGLCLKLMSGKPFMLNVSNPLAAWHGALLIRFLNGSTVKSEVVGCLHQHQPQLRSPSWGGSI